MPPLPWKQTVVWPSEQGSQWELESSPKNTPRQSWMCWAEKGLNATQRKEGPFLWQTTKNLRLPVHLQNKRRSLLHNMRQGNLTLSFFFFLYRNSYIQFDPTDHSHIIPPASTYIKFYRSVFSNETL